MKIVVTRTLNTQELSEKINRLARKRSLSEEEHRLLLDYRQAYRAYEESGEIFRGERLIHELNVKEFRSIFTTKRMDILNKLDARRFNSITSLSRFLKRNIKNVYDDLAILQKVGLVKLERMGKTVSPKINVDSVSIEFMSR